MSQILALSDSIYKRSLHSVHDEKNDIQKFRNIIDNNWARLENKNRHFDDDMNTLKNQIALIKNRINHLEHDLQSASNLEVPNVLKPSDSYSCRLAGGQDTLAYNSSIYQSAENHSDCEQTCKESDKMSNYNDFVAKYTYLSRTSSQKASRLKPLQQMQSSTLAKVPNVFNMNSSVDPLVESVRRATKRRQYRMNMLTYHKSHFSLRVSRKQYNFLKSLHIAQKISKPVVPRSNLVSLLK